jgi:hypothetical protein
MPTSLKRGNLEELEAADVGALVASAGLDAPAAGGAPRNDRRDSRGGRQEPRKGAPANANGPRPPHKGGPRRPHGQGKPHAPGNAGAAPGREGDMRAKPHHGPRNNAAQGGAAHPNAQQPAGPRPPSRRGSGPKHRMAIGRRATTRSRPDCRTASVRRDRPARSTISTKCSHSNANASPFGRSSLSAPAARATRLWQRRRTAELQRPARAQREIRQAEWWSRRWIRRGQDHRRSGPDGFKGPGRGQRPANRARGEVDGNGGAHAAPRPEVNGNVAPPNEKPPIPDDD